MTKRRKVLVDLTVAVVVDAIAAFGLWSAWGGRAGQPRSIGFTAPRPAVLTSSEADFACCPFVGKILVDLTVAVVVNAIADLGLRSSGLNRTYQT